MGALKVVRIVVTPQVVRPLEYVRIAFETRHMDTDALTTPSTSNKITAWASDDTTPIIDNQAVTQDAAGLAHYDYRIPATLSPGIVRFRLDPDNGGGANVNSGYGQFEVAWA